MNQIQQVKLISLEQDICIKGLEHFLSPFFHFILSPNLTLSLQLLLNHSSHVHLIELKMVRLDLLVPPGHYLHAYSPVSKKRPLFYFVTVMESAQ